MHKQAYVTPRNSLDLNTWKIVCMVFTMKFVWSIHVCMYSTRVSMGVGGGVPPPAQSEKLKGVENEQNRILYRSF